MRPLDRTVLAHLADAPVMLRDLARMLGKRRDHTLAAVLRLRELGHAHRLHGSQKYAATDSGIQASRQHTPEARRVWKVTA